MFRNISSAGTGCDLSLTMTLYPKGDEFLSPLNHAILIIGGVLLALLLSFVTLLIF